MFRLNKMKKMNTIYGIYCAVMAVLLIVSLFVESVKPIRMYLFIGIAVFSFIFIAIFHNEEINYDKKIINNMVFEGKMALAKINKATFEKIYKDSALKKYIVWKVEMTVYDKNMNHHGKVGYELVNPNQDSIPQGYVYVTYDEANPDHLFIIPNMLVGAYETNKDLILNYEKNIKDIKYLNVYYHKGMVIETFRTSMDKKLFDYRAKHPEMKGQDK